MIHKIERLRQRAPKRHWAEEEDIELMKGFQKHGYNWKSIIEDPDLHFDNRSANQVRDRFRLKHKDLYARQDMSHIPNKAAVRAEPGHSCEPRRKTRSSKSQGNTRARARATEGETGRVLNVSHNCEDRRGRLANSSLHNVGTQGANLTLAPSASLAWEDMATRPMFPLD